MFRRGRFHARPPFLTLALPHLEAVYADAYCLCGDVEDASDLVIETYRQAHQSYGGFFQVSRPAAVCDWLLGFLHAAFCARCLAQQRAGE